MRLMASAFDMPGALMPASVSPLTENVNSLTGPACKVPDMPAKTLAERAAYARRRAGFLKESDAAKAIGCSRTLVISWEDGNAKSIGGKYLVAAARAYKVRPEWLTLSTDDDGYPWVATQPPPPSQPVQQQRETIAAVAAVMDHIRDYSVDPLPDDKRLKAIDAAILVVEEVGVEAILSGSGLQDAARKVVAKIRGKAR